MTAAPRLRCHRAFSLIEAAIVLGLIGLVLGGIWLAAASVMENRRQTVAVTQFGQIVSNLRKLYKDLPIDSGFVAFTTGQNNDLWPRVFPAEMLTTAGRIKDPWGNDVYAAVQEAPGFPRYIQISIYWPEDDPHTVATCAALGPKLASALRRETAYIPGDPVVYATDSGGDLTTPSLATTHCQQDFNTYGMVGISLGISF